MGMTNALLAALIGITLLGFLSLDSRLTRLLDIAEHIKRGGNDRLL